MGTSHTTASNEAAKSASPTQDVQRAETTSTPEGSSHAHSYLMRAAACGAAGDSPSGHGSIIARSGGAPQMQAGMIQRLQKSRGNGYVARMLQRKLTVNAPGDEYEREADHMADRVVRAPGRNGRSGNGKSGCSECSAGAPCEKCRAKAMRANDRGSHTTVPGAATNASDVEPKMEDLFRGDIKATGGEMWGLLADKGISPRAGIELLQDMFKGGGSLTVSRDWVMGDPVYGMAFEAMFDGEMKGAANAAQGKALKGDKSGQGTFSKTEHTTAGPENCIIQGPWCNGPTQSWESSGADLTIEGEFTWSIPSDGLFIDLRFFNIKGKFRESYVWRDRGTEDDGRKQEEQTPFWITGEWDEEEADYQHPLPGSGLPTPGYADVPDDPAMGRGAYRAAQSTAYRAMRALSHHDTIAQRSAVNGAIQARGGNGGTVSATTEKKVEGLLGGGVPLPKDIKERMENGFGEDFSAVRIHTGGAAAETARELSAHAYTIGSDIVFNDGKFNPASADGEHLLAHELTHVVQQGGSVARSIQREGDGEPQECVDAGTSSDPMMSLPDGGGLPPEAAAPPVPPSMVGMPVAIPAPKLGEPGGEKNEEYVTIPMQAENPTPFIFFSVPAEVLYRSKEDAQARKNPLSGSTTPAGGTPAAGTPAAGTPAAGTPAAGTPAAGAPAAGAGTPAAGGAACPPGKVQAAPPAAASGTPAAAGTSGGTPVIDANVGQVFTPDGVALNVVASSPTGVIVSQYTKYAVGAASTSVLNVGEQIIVIDGGISTVPNVSSDVQAELRETTLKALEARIDNKPISQILITHGHTDHIELIADIASRFEVQSIRLNELQEKHAAMHEVLNKVRDAVEARRTRIAKETLASLESQKGEWIKNNSKEGTKPETLENSWKEYRDARLKERLGEIPEPRLERLVNGPDGVLRLVVEGLGRSPTGPVPEGSLNEAGSPGSKVQMRQFSTTEMSVEAAKYKPGEDIDKTAKDTVVDTNATNYIVQIQGGARFMVLPDLRHGDYKGIVNQFKAAAGELNVKVDIIERPVIQIWDITHHMQAGWTDSSGTRQLPTGGEVSIRAVQLGEITRFLREFRIGQQANGAAGDVVVVSVHADTKNKIDASSKVNPLNMWVLRSMGFEGYLATRGKSVDVYTVETSQKRKVTGIAGEAYAGAGPAELLIDRTDAALSELEKAKTDAAAEFEKIKADYEATQSALKQARSKVTNEQGKGETELKNIKKKSIESKREATRTKWANELPKAEQRINDLVKELQDKVVELETKMTDLETVKTAADAAELRYNRVNDAKLKYIQAVDAEIGRSHKDDATKNKPWEAPEPTPDLKEPGAEQAQRLREVLNEMGYDKPVVRGAKPHFDAVALVLIRKEKGGEVPEPGTPKARARELAASRDRLDRLLLEWKETNGSMKTRMDMVAEFSRYEYLLKEHVDAGGVEGPSLDVLSDELKTTRENLDKLMPKDGTKTSYARDEHGQLVEQKVISLAKEGGAGTPEGVPEGGAEKGTAPEEGKGAPEKAAPEKAAAEPMPELTKPGAKSVETMAPPGSAPVAAQGGKLMKAAQGINTASGHFFGAVMVIHSIKGSADLADKAMQGKADGWEIAAGAASNLQGLRVGLNMARGIHVNPAEFVVISVLDIAYTASQEYETSEKRDAALVNAGIRNGLNLGLMVVGGVLMKIPHPAAILAGLLIMAAGDTILNVLGVPDMVERLTGFNPSEVTGAFQDLTRLIDKYEVIVGAIELAARNEKELTKLGASQPEEVRKKAHDTIDEYQRKGLEHELFIGPSFIDAYVRARTSYAGLQELDQLRDRYQKLRKRAYPGDYGSYWGAEEEDLLNHLDKKMTLDSMSPEQIREMEQWSELDDKIDALHADVRKFNPNHIDWKSVAENDREASLMIDNARYRLNPGAMGGPRTKPMLTPGLPARQAYEAELAKRERRLADIRGVLANRAVRMNLPDDVGITGDQTLDAPEPGAENMPDLDKLQTESFTLVTLFKRIDFGVRAYRTILAEGNLPPGMTPEGIHADTAMNAAYLDYIASNDDYRAWLYRLKASESALTAQSEQAMKMYGDGKDASPDETAEYRRLLEEVKSLIQERRVIREILFPEEARSRGASALANKAHETAQALGQGDLKPLSPSEEAALKSGELEGEGERLSTMEDQLARAEQERLKEKTTDLVGASLLVGNMELVGLAGGRTLTAADNVLVVPIGYGPEMMYSEMDQYHRLRNVRKEKSLKVMPVNQAAIDIFHGLGAKIVLTSMVRPMIIVDSKAYEAPHN